VFGLEDEVVIIEVRPKMCNVRNEPEPGIWSGSCNYEKELYEVNQSITRRPEYLAIRNPDTFYIELLFRIDQAKSRFEKGQIVPQGNPIKIIFRLQVKSKSLKKNVIWYTTFRTLLTHNSTDEFTEEKSPIITRVITEDARFLCNGYFCIHFTYCKFFNHSQSPVIKTQTNP
jgi:hypothetical protein